MPHTLSQTDQSQTSAAIRPFIITGVHEASSGAATNHSASLRSLAAALSELGIASANAYPATREALSQLIPTAGVPLLLVPPDVAPAALRPLAAWLEESESIILAAALVCDGPGVVGGSRVCGISSPCTAAQHAALMQLAAVGAVICHEPVAVSTSGSLAASIKIALQTAARCNHKTDELTTELTLLRKTQERADKWLAQIDQELHQAAAVQRDMLGEHPPIIPGLEICAIFRPVWHVSGDIYSMAARDGGLTFVLADAMGHGLGAAMHSMIITHELLCAGMDSTPARALARLNTRMCASATERVRFATAVYGHIDPVTRVAHLASAGHPAPLLLRDGKVIETDPDGAILGVFPDAEFIQATVKLLPGDTLVMYSDGVEQACIDAAHCREDHKGDEHRRLLTQTLSCERPLQEGVERLIELLSNQRASLHQNDDLTVLAIRITS